MFNQVKEQQQSLTGLTLTQGVLAQPKMNVTHRQSGLASKGPVARAPMGARTTTNMSATLNVGGQ